MRDRFTRILLAARIDRYAVGGLGDAYGFGSNDQYLWMRPEEAA